MKKDPKHSATVEKFLAHKIAQKWGGGANTGIRQVGEVLSDLCFPGCTVLLVGTGWDSEQYHDWPNLLRDTWGVKISYLEIDEGYINRWKNGPYPLYEGSVTNIKDVIPTPFDVILWVQGPEHIKYEEMLPTFEAMYSMSNKGIICTCPWGGYYDYQGAINNNPAEEHVQKSMDENTFGPEFSNYQRLFGGTKDEGDGQILIWRKHEERS